MIKMAQLEHIKKMYYLEGLSVREISRRTGHHRDTIAKYLDSTDSEPPRYRLRKAKPHRVLDPFIPIIDEILKTDLTRHRKQRHTGTRIYERLKSEYDYSGGYSTITDYLRSARQKTKEGFLPLEFDLGQHAEVDWMEAWFHLRGQEKKAYLFVMKLGASGGFFVRAYPFEKQEAFFDGHRRCFEFMGGVPGEIAYDNLKTAVKKVLQGSQREEQERFIAIRTQYLYQANFCRPRRGNEKGGVEKAGQEAVRKFFVPYPDVDSFEELNEYLQQKCVELLAKNPRWEAELRALRPLPAEPFHCVRYAQAKVNTYSMIQFETNRYSVPVRHVGQKVLIRAAVDKIEIIPDDDEIVTHRRIYGRKQEILVLDHYLELLLMKSRALPNTRVYRPETLPPVYEEYRRGLAARDPRGNRQFVRILMLNRQYPTEQIEDAIGLALAYNVYNYDGLLNILMQLNTDSPRITSLSNAQIAHIPEVHVMPPDLSKYSALVNMGGDR
jgi:transposase